MKGFDVYIKLDKLLNTKNWRNKFEFTYIGNLPRGFYFKNSKHKLPLSGEKLAEEISKNHVYLTASINEPAGMHHIEGILSGLPIIFRNSGALPEYCSNYGIKFNEDLFVPALEQMFVQYEKYRNEIIGYPNTANRMTKNYLKLFDNLLSKRDEIVAKRNLLGSPLIVCVNFLMVFLHIKIYIKRKLNFFSNQI